MKTVRSGLDWRWQVLCFVSLCGWSSGQLRYSVLEEAEPGTLVGNVALDLGLELAAVSKRKLRLGSESRGRYFSLNLENGDLAVSEKIDRESLCGASPRCVLSAEVVIENPLELFSLEVEILDRNDNSPSFLAADSLLRITELLATPGTRFPLESARDPDVGVNSVSQYRLNKTPYFSLSVSTLKDGSLLPELVLEKPLDREVQDRHLLVLTASDGGSPARSGTSLITVIVLDVNDNAPVFNQSVYKVKVREDAPVNTILIQLNASDADEGMNGEIEYLYGDHSSESVCSLFFLESSTGLIRLEGPLDFEEVRFFEVHVRARDKGVPEMEGRCIVQVEIEDVNDNAPELIVTSLATSVPENTPVGTAVGLFQARDKDSGQNGEVKLELLSKLPFQIKSFKKHYSLITDGILDRENVNQYTIELIVTDFGSPPLYAQKTIFLNISDINDNPPRFSQPALVVFIKENNKPGALLCTVSASDVDEGANSRITYSILESLIDGSPVSSFLYISSSDGNIYAERSFDFELVQVIVITILAEDAGDPTLSSNLTVYVYVSDENDNAPVVLYPVVSEDLTADQSVPLSFPVGYLATKVTAVDADCGHNAWLSYTIVQSTDPTLFRISPSSGEIRAARGFQERDNRTQKLIIQVKDNGVQSRSTTVTILLSLEATASDQSPKTNEFYKAPKDESDMTLYLILALVCISALALVTFIILSAKCIMKETHTPTLCCCPEKAQCSDFTKYSCPTLQLTTDGNLRYTEVSVRPVDAQNLSYKTCLTSNSDNSDFTFRRPLNFTGQRDAVNKTQNFASLIDGLQDPSQVRELTW